MPGIAFRRGEAARGLDGAQVLDGGQVDLRDLGARIAQSADAAFESARHGGVEVVQHLGAGHREPVAGKGRVAARDGAVGQRLVGEDRIAHRPRHRAHRVQRARQRQRAVQRHQPRGVLEADDAIECRGNPDRAAGVRTQADERGAGGDRHRRARGRPARNPGDRGIGGIRGRAVVRIDANPRKREFAHVGAAQHDRAGGAQAGDGCAVLPCSCGVSQDRGTGRSDFSGSVEQILHRHRQSGQRPQRLPRVGGLGAGRIEARAQEHMLAGPGLGDGDGLFKLGRGGGQARAQAVPGGVEVGGHGWKRPVLCYNLWVWLVARAALPNG